MTSDQFNDDARKPIALFWKHLDGRQCYLRKRSDGWWLTIERDGEMVKQEALRSARDAFDLANEWRQGTDSGRDARVRPSSPIRSTVKAS